MPPLALRPGGTPRPVTEREYRGSPGDTGAAQHLLTRHLATALHASYRTGAAAALALGAVVRGRGTGRQAPHRSRGRTPHALRARAEGEASRLGAEEWMVWETTCRRADASSLCPFVPQRSKAGFSGPAAGSSGFTGRARPQLRICLQGTEPRTEFDAQSPAVKLLLCECHGSRPGRQCPLRGPYARRCPETPRDTQRHLETAKGPGPPGSPRCRLWLVGPPLQERGADPSVTDSRPGTHAPTPTRVDSAEGQLPAGGTPAREAGRSWLDSGRCGDFEHGSEPTQESLV